MTRLDHAYYIHILSKFMQNPREKHWEVAIRVITYLKKHQGQDIDITVNWNYKDGVIQIRQVAHLQDIL